MADPGSGYLGRTAITGGRLCEFENSDSVRWAPKEWANVVRVEQWIGRATDELDDRPSEGRSGQ